MKDYTKKPELNNSDLITLSMKSKKDLHITVDDVYTFIENVFPYYKNTLKVWKNALRHTLSESNNKTKFFVQNTSNTQELNQTGRGRKRNFWTFSNAGVNILL